MSTYIGSDSNIWIDLSEIGHIDDPFKLINHEFYISADAFREELVEPSELRKNLLKSGLQIAEISEEEFALSIEYRNNYRRLSQYDSFALAIAKSRSWVLLTGDKALRNAAEKECVECHGLLWIYDQLRTQHRISKHDLRDALSSLLDSVQKGRSRIPVEEINKRLSAIGKRSEPER